MLLMVIEGLMILGEREQAAQLYPLVLQMLQTGSIYIWAAPRFTQTIAAVAAAATRQWEAAERHFDIAVQQAQQFPHQLEQADIRRFHAMMLFDRAAPGDHGKARTLLREALASYRRIGMPRHGEMTQVFLEQTAAA